MKRIILLLFILCTFFVQSVYASCELKGVAENDMIVYSPCSNVWSVCAKFDDGIILTRKVSSGTGSFSYYTYNNSELTLNTNYEFIYNERLFGIDNENLKYYEIVYNKGNFEQKLMTEEEIQQIFCDSAIVKISEFKNGIYNVLSNGNSKKVLLYNDTDKNFHKYFLDPSKYSLSNNIKGLIQLPKRGKVKFSHIGDSSQNTYIIRVR